MTRASKYIFVLFKVDQYCFISSCIVLYEQVTDREPIVARVLGKTFLYYVYEFHKAVHRSKRSPNCLMYISQKKLFAAVNTG